MKTVKSTLLLLALGATALISGCKKEDKEIDPRDAFVGTYEMEGECGGGIGDMEDDLEIEKDAKDAKSLSITFGLFKQLGKKTVTAEIKGNEYEIEPFDISGTDDDGNSFTAEVGGSGELNGKSLSLTITIDEETTFCEFEGDKQ